MSKQQTIKLTDLVLDYDLYPRTQIDAVHVAHMVDALEAGETLPPLIVDRASKRIVDGFHRYKAFKRHYDASVRSRDPQAKKVSVNVPVILRDYPDEATLYLQAMTLNSTHGRRLSSYDRVRCIAQATTLHIDPASIAGALRITVDKLAELRTTRMAHLEVTTPGKRRNRRQRQMIALKFGNRHLAGQSISVEQMEANASGSGMTTMHHVNELLRRIRGGLIEMENEKLMERLHELAEAITRMAVIVS